MQRHPRQSRNRLREWLAQHPKPMSIRQFAVEIGVTPSYVSQLTRDDPPWPKREIALRIWAATKGAVSPNDLAGVSTFPGCSTRGH